MANDVSIVVSAELGDTLIKLDLAKHAINDLGDASLENAAKQDEAAASSGLFSDALGLLNSALTTNAPLLFGMSAPLVALPAVALGATIAVIALADAIGTLIAIGAALVAPLTLVTGLLGLLGAGFFIAAKKAFGMHEDGLGQAISGLKKQFNDLTTTLVGDFMPVFRFLIHNAQDALDYLNRIAKLPLNQAFKSLATQGVPAVTKFLEKVGSMLAKPIRMAVQVAFGTGKGGNEIASAVSGLWKQLTDFLFGYTQTHKIHIGRALIVTQSEVQGIFQPLIDWFNRHDFTKQGIKIGHEMLAGFLNSGAAKRIGQFLVTVLVDAIHTVTRKMESELGGSAVSFILGHWQQIAKAIENLVNPLGHVVDFIRNNWGGAISNIAQRITGAIGGAINTVIDGAKTFWGWLQKIANFFSQVFTLNINWPSPPSWLTSLGGILGGGGSSSTAGRTGTGGNSPGNPGGHIAVAHFHFHGSNDTASFRRFAREVGREIGRQNHILAGGQ